MNYSALYQASSKLHPGSPITSIVELIRQSHAIHDFDRDRLFHVISRQTNVSVKAVYDLYTSSEETSMATGESADMKWTDFETHEQVIRALVSVEAEDVHPKIANMIRHAAQFLIEQERLGEEAVVESIEEISKGPAQPSPLDVLLAVIELIRR